MLETAAPSREEAAGSSITPVRRRLPAPSIIAVAVGFAVAFAYAVLVLSPRFRLTLPSTIDDWNGATSSNRSLGQLLSPFFDAPTQRFRPGFTLFDHLEWHTLGAPGMTGPNLWNLVRIALLLAAVGVVPALLARSMRPTLSPLFLAAIAALAPALLITGVVMPIDLARLAPQEPMLIGATVCGGALVLLALDRAVAGAGAARIAVPLALGWPLFLLGIFFKEASVAFLVVAPFAYLHLARSWRERGLVRGWRDPLRNWRAIVLAGLLVVPLLWVVFQSARAGGGGADLYGAGTPHGLSGWIERSRRGLRVQWDLLSAVMNSRVWRALALSLPVLLVAVWADRRRVPWLALGVALAGWAMLVIQGLPGIFVSRYYIPTLAMFVLAAVLLLGETRAWLRWLAVAATVVFVLSGARAAHKVVRAWSNAETSHALFVDHIAPLVERGCVLHMTGVGGELAESLPRLVALRTHHIAGPCPLGSRVLMVTPGVPPAARPGLWAICREPWKVLFRTTKWSLSACDRPRKRASGAPVEQLLHEALLVPGVGRLLQLRCRSLRGEYDPSCNRPRLDRNEAWPKPPL